MLISIVSISDYNNAVKIENRLKDRAIFGKQSLAASTVARTSTTLVTRGSTLYIQSWILNIIGVERLREAVSESVLVVATTEHEY